MYMLFTKKKEYKMSEYQNPTDLHPLEDIANDEILSLIHNFKNEYSNGINKSNYIFLENEIEAFPQRILSYILEHTTETEILETYVEYGLFAPSSHTVHGLEDVAKNPNTPPNILHRLSKLGYVYLPVDVANNPSTSTDTLKYMKRYCKISDGKNAAIEQLRARGEE